MTAKVKDMSGYMLFKIFSGTMDRIKVWYIVAEGLGISIWGVSYTIPVGGILNNI